MVALTVSKFIIKKHPENYIVSLIEFFSLSEYYSKDEKISSKFLFDRLSFLNALIFFHAPQLCSKLRDQGLGPELYVFSSRVMSYSLISLKHNTRTPTLEHRYAVSWIVTLYADVFSKPQDLLQFWDVLILSGGNKVLNSLLIGVSILIDVERSLRVSSFETNLLNFSKMKRGLNLNHVERTS